MEWTTQGVGLTEVALKVVEEQGTAGAENKIDLQTVCQDAVGTDANGPVPNPMAAAQHSLSLMCL
jgi:hypothetical protein